MWIHLRPVLPHLQEVSRGFKQVHRAYRSIIAAGVVGGLRRTFRVRLQLGLLAFAFDLMHGYPAHGIVGSYTGPPFSTSIPPAARCVQLPHPSARGSPPALVTPMMLMICYSDDDDDLLLR